ncbi:MAG: hypothetical protein RR555_02685 [Bacteroidales bacterium]
MKDFKGFQVPEGFREPPEKGQRGSTCGLYAIEYAAVALGNTSIPATKGDAEIGTAKANTSLRQMAKQKKLSKLGEMFSVTNMVSLISTLPPGDKRLKGADVDCSILHIQEIIKNNGYCLVPFDVCTDDDEKCGLPCTKGGLNAHWCTIVGYREKEFLVYHWGEYFRFNSEALIASNKQLTKFPESFYIKWKKQEAKAALKAPFDKIWASMQSCRDIGNISYSEIVDPDSKGMAMILLKGLDEYTNEICNIIKLGECDCSDLRERMVTVTL